MRGSLGSEREAGVLRERFAFVEIGFKEPFFFERKRLVLRELDKIKDRYMKWIYISTS